MNRYWLGDLELVLASDHEALVASLRQELAGLRERPATGGPLPIGMRRTRAVITAHEGGKYTVRCACGKSFERGRSELLRADFWRCMACYRSQVSR